MDRDKSIVLIVAIVAVFALIVGTIRFTHKNAESISDSVNFVQAQVVVDNVNDLMGAQLSLSYDPAVVSYQSVSEGTFLDKGDSQAAFLIEQGITNTRGAVSDIIVLRSKDGVSGSGVLVTATFKRVGQGDPAIKLRSVLLSDSNANSLAANSVRVSVQ